MTAVPETVAVFDDWARTGRAEGMERGHGPRAAVALNRIPLSDGRSALDLGCGNGWATRVLRAGLGASGSAVGLDASTVMVERAAALSENIPGLRFVHGAFEALPFPEDAFDHVFSFEALYYSSDLDRSLAEIRRVLRSDGTLTIGTDHYLENEDCHSWSTDLGIPMEMMDESEWAARVAAAGFDSVETFRCLDPRPVDPSLPPDRRAAVRRFRTEVGTLGIFAR